MKLYATSEYMSSEISFEKNEKIISLQKMKLYTTSEYMSSRISMEKNKK